MLWWFDGSVVGGPTFELLGVPLSDSIQRFYSFLLLAPLAVLYATNLRRSHTGRAMAAVRDRDVAASVMRVDVARTKCTAFGLSSLLAGVAGAMFGWEAQYLTIDATVDLLMSIEFIAMIVLGGDRYGRGDGPGAARRLPAGWTAAAGRAVQWAAPELVQAVLVAASLSAEPLGMYGVWLRVKLHVMAWPFRYRAAAVGRSPSIPGIRMGRKPLVARRWVMHHGPCGPGAASGADDRQPAGRRGRPRRDPTSGARRASLARTCTHPRIDP